MSKGRVRKIDAARPWSIGLQEPASPVAQGIGQFHGDRMRVRLGVTVFVSWVLARCVWRFEESQDTVPATVVHGTVIEVVWTRVPARVLVCIAVPSFSLLYAVDELSEPGRTVKVVGHQWYWTYELGDYEEREFEAYRVDKGEGESLRRLEVDNRRVRPIGTHIRRLVTAADVLHSWAVPALGVKLDACPGRLNQVAVYMTRPGVYYGQCSEICGANHGFIPVVVEGCTPRGFRGKIAE